MTGSRLMWVVAGLSASLLLAAAEPAATNRPAPAPAPATAPAAKPAATTPAASAGSSSSAASSASSATAAAAADKGDTAPSRIESTEKVRADFEVSFPVDI